MKFRVPNVFVHENGLFDLITDREDRIERSHGFLENHSNPASPNALHFLFPEIQKVFAVKKDLAPGDFTGWPGNEAENRQG